MHTERKIRNLVRGGALTFLLLAGVSTVARAQTPAAPQTQAALQP